MLLLLFSRLYPEGFFGVSLGENFQSKPNEEKVRCGMTRYSRLSSTIAQGTKNHPLQPLGGATIKLIKMVNIMLLHISGRFYCCIPLSVFRAAPVQFAFLQVLQ